MYHYTESGLRNIWLANGYVFHDTPYGKGVSIPDVDGLHKVIGTILANKPKLTGCELRYMRKEIGLSQGALATLLGTSEQNISLWERRGRIPKSSDRLMRVLYLEHIGNNVKIREWIERLNSMDQHMPEKKRQFEETAGTWKEAA